MKILPKIIISLLAAIVTCCSNKENKINNAATQVDIQVFGTVPDKITNEISEAIRLNFGFKVFILLPKKLPEKAFVNIKSPRYRADTMISLLSRLKWPDATYIIGVTAEDISTTVTEEDGSVKEHESKYEDWGIFGLGYMPGDACIVSTFRLKHDNEKIYFSRIKKVSLHELGHNMGLDHCEDKHCVMTDAVEKISTVDFSSEKLCDKCRRIIGN